MGPARASSRLEHLVETVELTLSNSRTYFLICGIVNAIAGAAWALFTFFAGLATCCLGCLVVVVPMIHLTVMIFDFVAVSRLRSSPAPEVYSFLKLTAILDIVAGLAIVPLILGILNLQILARPEIYAHFHRAETV